MAVIFALESSAKAASVAITRDGTLLGEQFLNVGLTHSQTLMPMTEALFAQTGLTPADIDLFAVAAGPGSFTGVRIGVAQIKGMAMALGRPCVPVSSLEAMCFSFCPAPGELVCPVMDARCGQVYNALFEAKNGDFARLNQDRALSIEELCRQLAEENRRVIFVGDGAQAVFDRCGLANAVLAPISVRFQRASGVALAAAATPQLAVSAADLAPVYLRLPQAQRELKNRQKDKEQES